MTRPPMPTEPLPSGWIWWWSGRNEEDGGEWLPCHEWSSMNTQNAGEAWRLEALGKMGPHCDSSKVALCGRGIDASERIRDLEDHLADALDAEAAMVGLLNSFEGISCESIRATAKSRWAELVKKAEAAE